jgi:hypothetical protein
MEQSDAPQGSHGTEHGGQRPGNGGDSRTGAVLLNQQQETSNHHSGSHQQAPRANWWQRIDWSQVVLDSLLLIVGIWLAHIYSGQLDQMIETNRKTERGLQISQRQLEQSERAWLKVSVTADSGFEFTSDGGARITVRAHIQNIGNSAATGITSSVKLVLSPLDDSRGGKPFFDEPLRQQTELCEKLTKTPIATGKTQSDFEQVIFPNDTDGSIGHGTVVSKGEVDKAKKSVFGKSGAEELIAPFIVGCVDYQFATATQHHQTGFIYMLQHHDRTLPPNIYPIRAIRVGHSIAAADVDIEKWSFGGFYAY